MLIELVINILINEEKGKEIGIERENVEFNEGI